MPITFATFNAHHGLPPKGRADNRLLTAAATGLHADVLGLQEVERHVMRSCFRDQPRAIAHAAGMQYLYAPARRVSVTGDDGIALLVRGEILRSASIMLPREPRHQRRFAIVARVRVAEREFTVATTHLQNSAPLAAQRQLEAVVEKLDAEAGPHVLLGDLNLDSRRVASHLSQGLVLAGGDPTFPAHSPARRIDHVAVRGMNIDAVSVTRLAVSDHCALTAALS